MPIFAKVVLAIVYLIVGLILAIPYCFLAGGYKEFPLVVLFFPAALFFAIIGACVTRRLPRHRKMMHPLVLGFSMYIFLPIILNGVTQLLQLFDYEAAARFVFNLRYSSLIFAPPLLMMTLWLIAFVEWGIAQIKPSVTRMV